jgi:paired amphipathic helix protein Sin3a
MNVQGLDPERLKNAAHFYELFLESCERLFDNDVEPLVFEDQMRYMFGSQVCFDMRSSLPAILTSYAQVAYNVFTIDKVIGALIKQVQAVLSDPQSPKLLELLKRERELLAPGQKEKTDYLWEAKNVVQEDNLFRVDWVRFCYIIVIGLPVTDGCLLRTLEARS